MWPRNMKVGLWTPHFFYYVFPIKNVQTLFIFLENHFKNSFELPLTFVLFYRENKIRKKNPKYDS